MINFQKGAEFDPGFAPYVVSFSHGNIIPFYNMLDGIKNFHQKKFKFQMAQSELIKLFENILSFYSGCLLWAVYISQKFRNEPKKILNNFSLGKNKDDYDFLYEVNFLIDYFMKYEKDCKYYLNKNAGIPEYWKLLTQTYKEFLIINENFINTKTTSDIKLPETVTVIDDDGRLDTILNVIEKAISMADLTPLLKFNILK